MYIFSFCQRFSSGHQVAFPLPSTLGTRSLFYTLLTPRNLGLRKMLGLPREVSVAVIGQAGSRA